MGLSVKRNDGTYRFATSRGARKSASFHTPPLTRIPFPFVTLATSRAAAHQFRFAPAPLSPPLGRLSAGSPSPPSAPTYPSSNTAPFLSAARMRVCLRLNGKRGRVSGRAIMCVVSGVGWVCVRQASEKEAAVVGTRARRSYGAKRAALPFVYGEVRRLGFRVRYVAEHTKPNPFSLSSSSTIVNLFRYTTPCLLRNCANSGSSVLT